MMRTCIFIAGITGFLWQAAQGRAENNDVCTCPGGGAIERGAVRYEENSHRQTITKIETEGLGPYRHCSAVWISFTEVRPNGDPYSFFLKRTKLRDLREEGCGESPARFQIRAKTYRFAFDSDSQPVAELPWLVPETDSGRLIRDASSKSNTNLWDSISIEDEELQPLRRATLQITANPEFRRTAWVIARKEITGHYVGMSPGLDRQESITSLNKIRKIKAGQVGQIEASNGRTAVVRFYDGSRAEKFSRTKNALRRWYDNTGGPYAEANDDLYTPLRACIVEVSLDDIIEVNDYLDQGNADRT